MTAKELVRHLMKMKDTTNVSMAEKLGISPQALSDRLKTKKSDNLTVTNFNAMLNAIGYKVVVVPDDKAIDSDSYEVD